LPSILGSAEYERELFLIQGYAQRGRKLRKDTDRVPEPVPMWRAEKGKKEDDPFFNTHLYLNRGWVDTLTIFYVAKMDASFSILQAISDYMTTCRVATSKKSISSSNLPTQNQTIYTRK
jgi:hypothetical protein